jgi:lauroyl/myristoyl acyltransferase
VVASYAVGWALVRNLPEPLARRLFTLLGDLVWWRRGKGVRRLEANLGRVLAASVPAAGDPAANAPAAGVPAANAPAAGVPAAAGAAALLEARVRSLSRAAMRSYLRYWLEVFRLPVTSRERIIAGMRMTNESILRAAVASGRGAIAALPHMGNWDHAGAWAALTGLPFTTVAERLQPESLFDRFVAFRTSIGMEVVPLTGGAFPPYDVLADRLRAGGLICLLADRDLTASGVSVDFFGEPARMPAGPAALALDTGAALLPVTLAYDPDGWHVHIHPEVPVPAEGTRAEKITTMTQAVADVFAAGIAAAPQDWHMLQRLWVADLNPARDPARLGAAAEPAA